MAGQFRAQLPLHLTDTIDDGVARHPLLQGQLPQLSKHDLLSQKPAAFDSCVKPLVYRKKICLDYQMFLFVTATNLKNGILSRGDAVPSNLYHSCLTPFVASYILLIQTYCAGMSPTMLFVVLGISIKSLQVASSIELLVYIAPFPSSPYSDRFSLRLSVENYHLFKLRRYVHPNSCYTCIISENQQLLGVGKQSYGTARAAYRCLEKGLPLVSTQKTYQKFKRPVADDAVRFILGPDNIQPISWGSRRVTLSNGNDADFPSLCRRRIPENLWRSYVLQFRDKNHRLSCSTFLKVVKAITSSDLHVRSSDSLIIFL